MSRGLGPTQRRALTIWPTNTRGLTIAELSDALDVPERRTRKIVDSLVERGLVASVRQAGTPTRVWLFSSWRSHVLWRERQALNLAQVIQFARSEIARDGLGCPNCGWRSPTELSGPDFGPIANSARC